MTLQAATLRQKLYIHITAERVDPAPAPASTPAIATNHREAADDYFRVLFLAPCGRLRIITCKEDRQWIVQTRKPFTSTARGPWGAQGFCKSTLGLKRVLRAEVIHATPGMRSFLDALPDKFAKGVLA